MRGNPTQEVRALADYGPIPACAGQPCTCVTWAIPSWAYPRVCGATCVSRLDRWSDWGLSPRVRGNPSSEGARKAPVGPIPACAGQPSRHTCEPDSERAYPRVCGATLDVGVSCWHRGGLSPRVRGNRAATGCPQFFGGPIPACAGQPCRALPYALRMWAYPRVCGATVFANTLLTGALGLSPRVRGNQALRNLFCPRLRPIPACAGQPR